MRLGKFKSKELLRSSNPPILFFRPLLQRLFPKQEWENLYFSISLSKHIYQIAYATSSFFYLISTVPALHESLPSDREWGPLLLTAGSIIAVSVILDFLLRLAASLWSRPLLKMAAPFASLYLTILFPLIAAFLKITRSLIHKLQIEETDALTDKSRLREMIRESEGSDSCSAGTVEIR
jgi:CBS domain containing-hemolysin-like protein